MVLVWVSALVLVSRLMATRKWLSTSMAMVLAMVCSRVLCRSIRSWPSLSPLAWNSPLPPPLLLVLRPLHGRHQLQLLQQLRHQLLHRAPGPALVPALAPACGHRARPSQARTRPNPSPARSHALALKITRTVTPTRILTLIHTHTQARVLPLRFLLAPPSPLLLLPLFLFLLLWMMTRKWRLTLTCLALPKSRIRTWLRRSRCHCKVCSVLDLVSRCVRVV